jgi:hypothetical protein
MNNFALELREVLVLQKYLIEIIHSHGMGFNPWIYKICNTTYWVLTQNIIK